MKQGGRFQQIAGDGPSSGGLQFHFKKPLGGSPLFVKNDILFSSLVQVQSSNECNVGVINYSFNGFVLELSHVVSLNM